MRSMGLKTILHTYIILAWVWESRVSGFQTVKVTGKCSSTYRDLPLFSFFLSHSLAVVLCLAER